MIIVEQMPTSVFATKKEKGFDLKRVSVETLEENLPVFLALED